MSTLSPYGMFGFKVRRPLSNQELIHHFSIHEPASEHPHYDLSLTLLNSTFAECVDKWYAMRGLVLMIASIFGLLSMYGLYTAILISNYESAPGWLMLLALLPIGMIGWLAYVVTLDAFTYTHYPSGSTARTSRSMHSAVMARCSRSLGRTSTGPFMVPGSACNPFL